MASQRKGALLRDKGPVRARCKASIPKRGGPKFDFLIGSFIRSKGFFEKTKKRLVAIATKVGKAWGGMPPPEDGTKDRVH